jgi:predicted enzyme related to lactoylglutathione lyase
MQTSNQQPNLPNGVDIHYLVEDTLSALPKYLHQGYSIAVEPFSTDDGTCAVLQDEQGNRLGILERPIEADQGNRPGILERPIEADQTIRH